MRLLSQRACAALAVLLAGLAVVTLDTTEATAARAQRTTQKSTTSTVPPRVVGVAVPGAPTDLSTLTDLTAKLGQAPGQVTWYAAWATVPDFDSTGAARIAATGAVPEVTWEPWDPAAGVTQPAYSLDRITAGAYDSYISRWAREIRSYGSPVVIRFAHEMNGNWYPWAEGVNGNGPGDFRAMWRHVTDVFRSARASNVTWTWAPNVPYQGSVPLPGLYPGDAYVGRVGLDGYNWSTMFEWSSWQSFADVFSPGLVDLAQLTTKPVYIAETASPEVGGDKAAWIRDMWAFLAAHPEVRGITWFSFAKEADWRIDSSQASLDAFAAGMSSFS
jgi:hypothetical protein